MVMLMPREGCRESRRGIAARVRDARYCIPSVCDEMAQATEKWEYKNEGGGDNFNFLIIF
jgi:hypothetical protein